ncbi:MAG TPA: sulfotransferase [Halioglobus sp.]
MIKFNSRALVDRAIQKAGHADFGGESWREGLDRLVDALNDTAQLTQDGANMMGYRISNLLTNRLAIEKTYQAQPEINDQVVQGPIFIIGLPRTGTTALSQLVAADPQMRSLRTWESLAPVPPPERATEHSDARIAEAQAGLDYMYAAYPKWATLHHETAETPTECQDLLGMEFKAEHFDGMAYIPAYSEWVANCDMTSAYSYHHRVLKLLQSQCPPNLWHLKTPVHMLYLDTLVAEYPNAKFLWSHRDPAEVLGSVCSLITYCRGWVSNRDDSEIIGEEQLSLWAEATRRAIDFRDRMGSSRFADLAVAEIQANPVAAIARAYTQLNIPFDDTSQAAIQRWAENHRPGLHGKHVSHLEDFGLNRRQVHTAFGQYTQRFGALLS